jgi:PPM family protein phosphatase
LELDLKIKPDAKKIEAAGLSNPGRVRPNNQDNYLVDLVNELFIVSDGMGGHQAGEIAARAVVTALPQVLEPHLPRLKNGPRRVAELTLREVILEFSQRLRDETALQAGLKGLGATLVMILVAGMKAYLAHMGDSRIYLFRAGQLRQLTEDHSVIAILLKHGDITPAEAVDHPARGQLSRYVGMTGETYPDVQTLDLQSGDRLLLCSDGLWGMLPDDQIARLLPENPGPSDACRHLVDAANQAGGKDNITVVIVDIP